MLMKYKQKNIVVIDITTSRRYIKQLATYLEIVHKNQVQLFTKNIFDIFLVNNDDYSQTFWMYLEDTLGENLNKFDLTHIEIIADLLIQCIYETFKDATGLDTGYEVLDVTTSIGIFKVRGEESLCLL